MRGGLSARRDPFSNATRKQSFARPSKRQKDMDVGARFRRGEGVRDESGKSYFATSGNQAMS
jgi:hypothetical protein